MHEVVLGILDMLPRALLTGLMLTLAFLALRMARQLQDRAPYLGKVRLVYPAGLKVLGTLVGLCLPGIFFMAGRQAWQEGSLSHSGFLIGSGAVVSLFAFAMMAEFLWTEVVADEAGLRARTPWGAGKSFRWEDLRSVAWSPTLSSLVLRDARGRAIRVSGLMLGLVKFSGLLLRRVPSAALEDQDLAGRLAAAAEGDTEWMDPLRRT